MDLGLTEKTAVVCASSKGLGLGCARALAEAGCNLIMNARGAEALEKEAALIRADFGVAVTTLCTDVSTVDGQEKILKTGENADILVTNAGGPPPGLWEDWRREDFIAALDQNMLAPIALIRGLLPNMIDKRWGRIINITSQAVKAPIPILGLSNSARAGLTGYVAGTARQVASYGITINNLLPGIHATARAKALDTVASEEAGISIDEARSKRQAAIPANRYGTKEEFGAMCAFLCSQHAGYIVGQNILLDGGSVNTTL